MQEESREQTARVSVVIRCFNEEEHIGRLLSGIAHQTIEDVEVLLVDSGSTDRTLEIAARFPVRIVTIEPEEFSFGRSLNRGCAAARGEFIVIVSAHTYPVYDDWLARMIAPFEDPRVAVVYGKQRGHETTRYSEHQIFHHWFRERSIPVQTHPFCNNANAAIRRSLWAEHPYDEELTGLEDLDWASRMLRRDHVVSYAAEAEIIHVHDETWTQIFNRYRREAIAFKRIFPDESFGLVEFVRLFTSNVASDGYHALRDRVLHRELFSIVAFRLMQFWGTYRGYRHRGPVPGRLRETFYYPQALERRTEGEQETGGRRRIAYRELSESERSIERAS